MNFKNTYYSKNGKMVFRLDMTPLTILWLVIAVLLIVIGVLFDDWAIRIFFIAVAIVPAPLFYPFRYLIISDTEFVMSFGIFRRKIKFSDVEKCIVRKGYISQYNCIYCFDTNGKRKSFGLAYYENIDKIYHELSKHVRKTEVFLDTDYKCDDNKLSDDAKKIIEKSLLKPSRGLFLFLAILFLVMAGGLGYLGYFEWDNVYTLSDKICFHYICPAFTVGIVLLALVLLDGTFGYIKVKDEAIVIKGLFSKKRLIKAGDVQKWRKYVEFTVSSSRRGGSQLFISKEIRITDYNGKEHKISYSQTEYFDEVLNFLKTYASNKESK